MDTQDAGTTREPQREGARALSTHALGIHTLVMYGIAYYAIGAAAPHMARDLSINTATIFGVLGAALIVHAFLAPHAGRFIDRTGAGPALLAGTIVRVLALVVLALAPNLIVFVLALAVVQFASIATEYDTAFAAAVQIHGEGARSSLSLITVWGGLASTAFWPLTAALLAEIGWRTMFLCYAGLMAAVSVPIALYISALTGQRALAVSATPADRVTTDAATAGTSEPERAELFLPLVVAFSFVSVAMGLPVVLPNILEGLGLGSVAVMAGMMFGPAQTAGRFFEFMFGRKYEPLAVAIVATAVLPAAILILLSTGSHWIGAVLFAILFGAGNGIGYVVRGTVVLSLFGPGRYASLLGRIARVRLVVAAATPIAITALMERYGSVTALVFAAACGCVATLAFLIVARRMASVAGGRDGVRRD